MTKHYRYLIEWSPLILSWVLWRIANGQRDVICANKDLGVVERWAADRGLVVSNIDELHRWPPQSPPEIYLEP